MCRHSPFWLATRFGTSAQLISGDLLSCHSGGDSQEARRKWRRKKRLLEENDTNKTRQPADPHTIAISQAAIGIVDSMWRTGGSIMAA